MLELFHYFDYPAAALSLSGRYLLGKKNIWGWVVEIGAGGFWHCFSFYHETWGQFAMSILIQIFNIKGLIEWKKQGG